MGPEVTNIRIRQVGESLTLALRIYSQHASDVINPLAFQPSTPIQGGVGIISSPFQQGSPISVNSPLSSINESILAARTPISSPPQLLVSSLKKNPRKGLIVAYLEVGGLGVELIFNKNVIKPGDNKEYIKEAINAIAILRVKRGYNYKNNILAYLKVSLN